MYTITQGHTKLTEKSRTIVYTTNLDGLFQIIIRMENILNKNLCRPSISKLRKKKEEKSH